MYRGTYTLVGSELSMFTRKLEAQLRYQNIPYEWAYKGISDGSEWEKRAGTRFIPLLETPDGWLINDTIAIGPMLSDRFGEAPVVPSTPIQRAACFVLEDYFNHWFPRHALHSRWVDLDNATHAGRCFGTNMLLGKSIDEALTDEEAAKVAGMGTMMRDSFGLGACDIQGAGADKAVEVQNDFDQMMDLFKQHFAAHDFLLGDRACIADFALVGPAKAHFIQDPLPLAWLAARDNEKMLTAYVDRVWNDDEAHKNYLADDQIPATLTPIFEHAKANYQAFARASIQAAMNGEKTFDLDLGHGVFTARSMKRLDKARLHVRDEIQGLALAGSVLEAFGVLALYEPERL
ncbi:MAG: glutathione S-transferase N-terminal domain-containing protein [Myxococcota bacterium]|jgi:glutathione S-transferase|nr:glutathione S-transferase N-terminal domain-containing protein [Myxococcota bacterium]